jgi:hypothetical protein
MEKGVYILFFLLGLMFMGFYFNPSSKSLLNENKNYDNAIKPRVLLVSSEPIKALSQVKGTLIIHTTFHSNTSQEQELKLVCLTKKDWEALEKITTKGVSKIAVVDYTTRINFLNWVQYTHENVDISKSQLEVLQKILEKY